MVDFRIGCEVSSRLLISCDTLVSFLFDVAWSRIPAPLPGLEPGRYEDFEAFNFALDDEYDDVEIAGSTFQPSKILYLLDGTQYESARLEWEAERDGIGSDQEAAA